MPVGATLRGKSSGKDLYRQSLIPDLQSEKGHPIPEAPSSVSSSPPKSSGLSIPDNANPPRRPSTSHQTSTTTRPELSRRPSSKRSISHQHLNVPRTRHSLKSTSEPDIYTKYKAQQHRDARALEEDDGAPAPTIGVTAPSKEDLGNEKANRRRTLVRPFGTNFMSSFRASSYGNLPKGRASDVGQLHNPQGWQSRPSDSSNEDNEHPPQVDGAGPSPLRYSESSATPRPRQAPPPPMPQSSNVGSKASQFFKFTRRKKQPEPLFPLPVKIQPPSREPTPKSVSNASSESPTHTHSTDEYIPPVPPIPGSANAASQKPSAEFARNGSAASVHSSPPVTIHFHADARSRAGTLNSASGHPGSDRVQTPHYQESGRNSTASTTLGRNSIAGLRSLTSRLRHPSELHTPRNGSPGLAQSGNNSFALSRETLVVPEREEGESAGKYYARLEETLPKRNIVMALSKSPDQFNKDVLRSLLRTFKFFEEPMDISMRKLLWEVSLPGEAQQIERVLNAFSERYHECNPHIFRNVDQTLFIAYSIIILHSDLFNPNNKTKMQRHQYQKNAGGEGVPPEILGYFYDNIHYTEFIGQNADEEDAESSKSKAASKKARRVKQKLAAPETNKNTKADPYVAIIDDKHRLENLKPVLKDFLNFEDTYSYVGTAKEFNVLTLRAAFARYGTLQITSSMSRPGAFANEETKQKPYEAAPGVVDIKVAKVGIVWRKDPKRRRTRLRWQAWGAVLTPSQLMFFRNVDWVKNLSHQVETHQKQGNGSVACVFKPALQTLTIDAKVATNDSIALLDRSYKRHKNAFVLARRGFAVGGTDLEQQHFEETLLAESAEEMNDWIAKFNYASTFMTSNVRMHSWHPGCKVDNLVEPRGSSVGQRPIPEEASETQMLDQEQQKKMSPQAKAAYLRTTVIKEKLASAQEELEPKKKLVEDHIRTARHVEILSPFFERTRSELISYGARLAHNIRWSRFDVARLECYSDMLLKELQNNESSTSVRGMGILDSEDRLFGLNGRHATVVKRSSKSDPLSPERSPSDAKSQIARPVKLDDDHRQASYRSSDIFESIDEAFATPPETLSAVEGTNAGDFRLLNLNKQASAAQPESPTIQSETDFRPSSVSSVSSKQPPRAGTTTPTQSLHEATDERRPSTASVSEVGGPTKETVVAGSPTSSAKSQARRSLNRTLREPRDALSQSSSRKKKNKEKDRESQIADTTDDGGSIHGSEGLARRRRGSFTVHGKKASVITIPEWEQHAKTTEERLRLRKQAASDSSKRRSGTDWEGLTEDEGSVAPDHRASVAISSIAGESEDE